MFFLKALFYMGVIQDSELGYFFIVLTGIVKLMQKFFLSVMAETIIQMSFNNVPVSASHRVLEVGNGGFRLLLGAVTLWFVMFQFLFVQSKKQVDVLICKSKWET